MTENKAKTVLRVVSGNFLEMYDFMVYGYYATYIGDTFFPLDSDFARIMASLAVFGAGFLMRPLGAIVLGAYIDHVGRRKGLLFTLGLMAVGTVLVAAVPGYAVIGVLAPLLVLIGRLLQGFSAGVELGGVSVYLAEIAPPGRTGFFTAWQSASQQVAVVFAALLGVALTSVLPPSAMTAYGWRIPFIVGCAIVPFLFVIRESLAETEAFKKRKQATTIRAIFTSIAHHPWLVVGGTCLVIMSTVNFYLITAYTPTFGRHVLNLNPIHVLIVTCCIGLSNFIWVPTMGALSDVVGRKPLLITFTVATLVTAFPVMLWLTAAPSFTRLLVGTLWLSFLYGSYNGAAIVTLTEVMPANARTVGFSFAYSLATTLGGSTPALSTYLVHKSGSAAAPAFVAMAAALFGLCGIAILTRAPAHPEHAE
jgi:MFS family permease